MLALFGSAGEYAAGCHGTDRMDVHAPTRTRRARDAREPEPDLMTVWWVVGGRGDKARGHGGMPSSTEIGRPFCCYVHLLQHPRRFAFLSFFSLELNAS